MSVYLKLTNEVWNRHSLVFHIIPYSIQQFQTTLIIYSWSRFTRERERKNRGLSWRFQRNRTFFSLLSFFRSKKKKKIKKKPQIDLIWWNQWTIRRENVCAHRPKNCRSLKSKNFISKANSISLTLYT